ncbi:hypothetical protein [Microbacterium hominis]|uniref:Uncharacterized protein n=1 Tax=Microbacterium hominis TaxID=162426 RepID=A0A7D4TF59_9MICO|nr:hypothetical protein [Microbacterium hominis]QKJ19180.1 hypothetical protein HQM25_07215 [Microbacterium hominis]
MTTRIKVNYPSKRSLTETEAANVLKHGPDLRWFEPWAARGVNLSDTQAQGWGYIHIYSVGGAFNYDFASWPDEAGLRAGLEALWHRHTGEGIQTDPTFPKCDKCESVMYFVPDSAAVPRLYAVIETDDEDES